MTNGNFDLAVREVARMPASGVNELLLMENASLQKRIAEKDFLIDRLLCENQRMKGTSYETSSR